MKTAVETSRLHTTTLIGEDTDLLVLLLCYHVKPHRKSFYFRSDKTTGNAKVENTNYLKEMIGNNMCSQLLLLNFMHAMTGCDTTSQYEYSVLENRVLSINLLKETILQYSANAFTVLHQPT